MTLTLTITTILLSLVLVLFIAYALFYQFVYWAAGQAVQWRGYPPRKRK